MYICICKLIVYIVEEEILVWKNYVIIDKSRCLDYVCKIIFGMYIIKYFMEKWWNCIYCKNFKFCFKNFCINSKYLVNLWMNVLYMIIFSRWILLLFFDIVIMRFMVFVVVKGLFLIWKNKVCEVNKLIILFLYIYLIEKFL